MASIKPYKTATGRKWRVQYRDPAGRARTKQGFAKKAEAEAWATRNAVALNDGGWVAPEEKRRTVSEYATMWLAGLKHRAPSTRVTYTQAYEKHVAPVWGARAVGTIRPSQVQAWIDDMDAQPVVVRRCVSILGQVLAIAVEDGVLGDNPARGRTLPVKPEPRRVYLTVEQLGRLAGACSRHSELVWLLGTSGLRWGEAVALRPCDLDPLRGRVRVERAVKYVEGVHVFGPTKTRARRSVAVARHVMDMLVGAAATRGAEELIWQSADGQPLRELGRNSWFAYAVQRVQSEDPAFPRITPHGLRHVAAGLLVQSGANVKVVQAQLGHASAAMTLDTYADLFDDGLDSVASALDQMMAPMSWECRGEGSV